MSPVPSSILDRPLSPWLRRMLGSPVFEAMAAPHGVSRYLELLSPLWTLEQDRARVTAIRRETPAAVTVVLRPAGPTPRFRCGQYVRLALEVDGVRHTRCFSVSSSEHRDDGQLEITVKAHPDGVVSRFLNERAEPGLTVGLSAPEGQFTLPAERPDRLLLLSGGSGITPVMSMLRTLCDEGHDRPVTFLHYARSREALIFGDELEAIADRHPQVDLVTVFTRSEPGPRSRGLHGRFAPAHLAHLGMDPGAAETYVCGPSGLIDAARAAFEEAGASDRLHVERFQAAGAAPRRPASVTPEPAGEVRFEQSRITWTDDGRTLLEQAEDAGLQPEYGCRMGVCHSCTRRLTGGSVRRVTDGQVCAEPGADVQLCVNVAEGDVSLDL